MKDLISIGVVELVSLPEPGLQAVSAKIDTGADGSAVWATDISENNNQLSFVLLGPNSPQYNGKKLTSEKYSVVSIKNSFGERELRYQVPLKITIAGRTITARFTLADRHRNKYPVLIGRRTLHGKFLVDVRKKTSPGGSRVLLLSTKRSNTTANFAKKLEAYNKHLKITFASYGELRFLTGGQGNRIELIADGRDIADFDLIYFKVRTEVADVAAACAQYAEAHGVPYMDRAAKHYAGESKLYDYFLLTEQKLPVPPSIFLMPAEMPHVYEDLADRLELPFVLKDVHGQKGNNNFLIKNAADFAKACKTAQLDEIKLIAQRYVPNDGDYRVLVFGTKVALIMHRTRTSRETHLNNTTKGASAELVEGNKLPPRVHRDCVQAARLTERQVSGVDIVQDKSSGLWYVLEVNIGPQLASGAFKEEKQAALAAYMKRRLS